MGRKLLKGSKITTQFGVMRYADHLVRHNTCQSCTIMQLPNEAGPFLWFDGSHEYTYQCTNLSAPRLQYTQWNLNGL